MFALLYGIFQYVTFLLAELHIGQFNLYFRYNILVHWYSFC